MCIRVAHKYQKEHFHCGDHFYMKCIHLYHMLKVMLSFYCDCQWYCNHWLTVTHWLLHACSPLPPGDLMSRQVHVYSILLCYIFSYALSFSSSLFIPFFLPLSWQFFLSLHLSWWVDECILSMKIQWVLETHLISWSHNCTPHSLESQKEWKNEPTKAEEKGDDRWNRWNLWVGVTFCFLLWDCLPIHLLK